MWINLTYPIYNWGYNLLTKWDEPPSSVVFINDFLMRYMISWLVMTGGLFIFVLTTLYTGWWFGTCMIFFKMNFHMLGMSSSQLTFIFFSGVGLNHQPVIFHSYLGLLEAVDLYHCMI